MNEVPKPHRLAPNPVPIFYQGGPGIAGFRGIDSFPSPEDWVGSVSRFPNTEDDTIGLAATDTGDTILDLIKEDPQSWLGRDYRTDDTGILVKLLDAGVRLPVHWHPTRAFAREHLSCPYGKAEGWIILSPHGGRVWLGFTSEPSEVQLADWLRTQDGGDMLAHMNEVPVGYGDIVYVPPGTAHAIDEGVLLLELQEPTSFSFILEHEVFNMNSAEAALGIDWADALQSIRHAPGVTDECVIAGGLRSTPKSLFPAAADEFFRASVLTPSLPRAVLDGYTIGVVIDGNGTLRTPHGADIEIVAGSTWAIPAAVGELHLEGDATVILCRPPSQLPELDVEPGA